MNSQGIQSSNFDFDSSLLTEYRSELVERIVKIVKYACPLYIILGGGLFMYVDIFISNLPQGPFWRAPSVILSFALLYIIHTRLRDNHPLIYYTYFIFLFSLSLMMSGLVWSVAADMPFSRTFSGLLMAVFVVYIGSSGGFKILAILYFPLIILPLAIYLTYRSSNFSFIPYINVYALMIPCLITSQVEENLRFKEFKNRKIAEFERNKAKKAYSELSLTQAQLIQSEKMASLGELTAGIAHELQNPLNFVNNYSEINLELLEELMMDGNTDNPEEKEQIVKDLFENQSKILYHGKRADGIVRGMQLHSHNKSGTKELTNLSNLILEHLRLAYQTFRTKNDTIDIKLTTDLDEDLPDVMIVPQSIGRVLLNILNNSFQAINEKNIESYHNELPQVKVSARKLDESVEIIISDNGTGIPDAIKDKIFQPFFTTKPTGKGTGLGLSFCFEIIKDHGGNLRAESNYGEMTQLIIELPVLSAV